MRELLLRSTRKPGHDRLLLVVGEELDVLRLALVEHAEVFLHQVGDETALVVGHRDRHDDFRNRVLELSPAGVGLVTREALAAGFAGVRRAGRKAGRRENGQRKHVRLT